MAQHIHRLCGGTEKKVAHTYTPTNNGGTNEGALLIEQMHKPRASIYSTERSAGATANTGFVLGTQRNFPQSNGDTRVIEQNCNLLEGARLYSTAVPGRACATGGTSRWWLPHK